jgi:hypothetical protein
VVQQLGSVPEMHREPHTRWPLGHWQEPLLQL